MLNTILLASSNAGDTVYIGPAPEKLNVPYVIPAVQFIWTDTFEKDGGDLKIGTLKLTAALWKTWWGKRTKDLWPWARDFRRFAAQLIERPEFWLACPMGCAARMKTLEGYEQHVQGHMNELITLHQEYLGAENLQEEIE